VETLWQTSKLSAGSNDIRSKTSVSSYGYRPNVLNSSNGATNCHVFITVLGLNTLVNIPLVNISRFHHCQNLYIKVQALGLQQLYQSDTNFAIQV